MVFIGLLLESLRGRCKSGCPGRHRLRIARWQGGANRGEAGGGSATATRSVGRRDPGADLGGGASAMEATSFYRPEK